MSGDQTTQLMLGNISEAVARMAESMQKMQAVWMRMSERQMAMEKTLDRMLLAMTGTAEATLELETEPDKPRVTLIEGEPAKPDLPSEA